MGASMRRREFIGFVGSVGALPAFFWRHAAWAQQARRIAFVHSGTAADKLTETAGPFWVRRFYETLRGLGDVEASNLVVERCSAEGLRALCRGRRRGREPKSGRHRCQPQRSRQSVYDRHRYCTDRSHSRESDRGRLVKNLAHPGGNLTGVSLNAGVDIYGKRLHILNQTIPSLTKVAYLVPVASYDS